MQPLIQNRKTEDTDLKRVFHPDCLKDPFLPQWEFWLGYLAHCFQSEKPISFTHCCNKRALNVCGFPYEFFCALKGR